jgi:hypothetical protein
VQARPAGRVWRNCTEARAAGEAARVRRSRERNRHRQRQEEQVSHVAGVACSRLSFGQPVVLNSVAHDNFSRSDIACQWLLAAGPTGY